MPLKNSSKIKILKIVNGSNFLVTDYAWHFVKKNYN